MKQPTPSLYMLDGASKRCKKTPPRKTLHTLCFVHKRTPLLMPKQTIISANAPKMLFRCVFAAL